jgi:hypothetical protein
LHGAKTGGTRRRRTTTAATPVARPMLIGPVMKDILFIVATSAFFAVAWAYAKSFDHL